MPQLVNPWLRRVLLVNLILEIGIVVTGGLVRLTGSGLGCPTWPQCVPGSFTPVAHQAQGFHKLIEFGNRTLTSVVGIAALLVIVAIWRWAPGRPVAARPGPSAYLDRSRRSPTRHRGSTSSSSSATGP